MKKILSFLLLTAMLATTILAKSNTQTHEELVDRYLTISGQKQAIEKMPTQMVNMIEQQFAQTGQPVDPQLANIIIEGLTNEEAIGKITKDIEILKKFPFMKLKNDEKRVKEIGDFIGVDLSAGSVKKVAVVHCSGDSEILFDYKGIQTCKAASQLSSGYKKCPYG